MKYLIKICGVTVAEDVAVVARAGANAIGINFWPGSKRYVGDDSVAAEVLSAVPAGMLKFGVFVNASLRDIEHKVERFGLDRVQLHGDERPDDFRTLAPAQLVRAIRVRNRGSFAEVATWAADLFLYDAFVDGFGGAGQTAPWEEVAAEAARTITLPRPFLLAGGLDPDNVAAAIAATRPSGVDVASGVESAPGRKDPARVAAFVAAARSALEAFTPHAPLHPPRRG